MNKLAASIITSFIITISYAQVGINTTSPNAMLDIQASNQVLPENNDGLLIPKVDAFPLTAPGVLQHGMLIYLTTTDVPSGSTLGFYYWNYDTVTPANSSWVSFGAVLKVDDLEDGKSDVDGTQDGSSIYIGIDAGSNDDATNNQNVGLGFNTLNAVDGAVSTEGNANVAVGYRSLQTNTTGFSNTGVGQRSLRDNTTGE